VNRARATVDDSAGGPPDVGSRAAVAREHPTEPPTFEYDLGKLFAMPHA
jgi:hypothetical protein